MLGYQGPTDLLLVLDAKELLQKVVLRKSYDNQPFVSYVVEDEYFFNLFSGFSLGDVAQHCKWCRRCARRRRCCCRCRRRGRCDRPDGCRKSADSCRGGVRRGEAGGGGARSRRGEAAPAGRRARSRARGV